MRIGIASPITISDFNSYLDADSQIIAKNLTGLKANSVDTLIKCLIDKGNTVSVYTLTPEVNEVLILKGNKLKIFIAPYRRKGWKRAITFFRPEAKYIEHLIQLDTELPEILNANWTYEYARGAAKYRTKIPIVVTIHDWAPTILKLHPDYYRLSRYIIDFFIFKTSKLNFIANSPYIAAKVKKRWGKTIPYIPNAISDKYLNIKNQHASNKIFTILSVSNNVGKGKNIETLLYAYQKFRKSEMHSVMNLVGIPFNLLNPTVQKWNSMNLLEGVNLLDSIDHVSLIQEYDKATVLVHPSFEESFGLVLIEAMARKLPVIGGKNSGAVPYVLDDGKAGILCDVSSIQSLYEAIIKIYEDEKLRHTLIDNGYKLVNSVYSQNAVTDQTLNIYKSLVNNKI